MKIGNEGSWRRFLPPVSDFVDALRVGKIRIYSSQGVATITPPESLWNRLRVGFEISWRYSELAQLRDACQLFRQQYPVNAYVESLRTLGFVVEWQGFVDPDWCTATPFFEESQQSEERV